MSRSWRSSVFHGALETLACGAVFILVPLRLVLRRFRRRPRSLWAGSPIVNMSVNARAERRLGVDARSLVYHTYHTTRAFDRDLSRWMAVPVLRRLVPYLVFVSACLREDRLHFYCDQGLLPPSGRLTLNTRELRVYRRLGIPVYLWTYGADVRTREATRALGEPNCCTECTEVGKACICDDAVWRRNHARLAELSAAIFSMGDMNEYTPGSVRDLFFWPVDLEDEERFRPVYPEPHEGPLRIVHAPNHRMFKGTHFLEEAVAQLLDEGHEVDLVVVEGTPREEALEIYRTADIIFDQCLVGFHGYFALEAMALGKPVICYIRKPEEYLLQAEECPLINTHVSRLVDDLRELLNHRERLAEIGRRGRRYVERYFGLEAFARRLAAAYERQEQT